MSFITSAVRMWLTRSFKPFEFSKEYDSILNFADTENQGLYVHIPFCRSICDFCPYCKTLFDEEKAKKYVESLLKEIDLVGAMSGKDKVRVTSVYFGGGSPAMLADDIEDIIQCLEKYFIITEGIGIELHPHDVNEKTLLKLKHAGVTKLSIGIQSFQKDYLSMLGRSGTNYDNMFRELSKVSFETVSMDFIFALPGQTIQLLAADIETAFSNGANHIAVYPFIDFTFTKRKFSKIRESEKKKLLYDMVEYCEEKGYVRDSIWTFSKDGNAKYSSMTRENFIGFGCSATTLLMDQFKINTFDIDEYIARIDSGKPATALTIKFTLRQRMAYYLFWTAYAMRVNEDRFREFFGKSLKKSYGLELGIARLFGFVKKDGSDYLMTTVGSYYYHYFENFYTLSYIDQMWNLMRKKAFPEKLVIK